MKQSRVFRVFSVSVVLCILVLALVPAATMAAERSIHVFPDKVAEGGKVDVRGSGFGSGYPDVALRAGFPFVTVYMALEEAAVGGTMDVDVKTYAVADDSSKVDEFGKFAAGFLVPSDLADGEYLGDVEEGTYFIYVTYWNDPTIVAASVLEVTEVVEVFPFWWGYPRSPWHRPPYWGCWPSCDDCLSWDCMPYPCPWIPSDGSCDRPSDDCGEWPPAYWYIWPPDDCCDWCPDYWCYWPPDGCCSWPSDGCCGEWSDGWDEEDCPCAWPSDSYNLRVITFPICDY